MNEVDAYVGIGGNVGDARRQVQEAVVALAGMEGVSAVNASQLYRTAAWGLTGQPDFVNAVARLRTRLGAGQLLHHLQQIEHRFGRRRDVLQPRWGPRTLDLDLLLYATDRIDWPGLRVPHPRMHERAFVLIPLLEIAPSIQIPGRGSVRDLAATMAVDGIEALGSATG